METIKVVKVEPKDDYQVVHYLMPDNRRRRSNDWSWHPFEVGQSYDVVITEKAGEGGRTYYNFGTIMPAEHESPATASIEPQSIGNGRYSPEEVEEFRRQHALNAAGMALGPLFALIHERGEYALSELPYLQIVHAQALMPFLRGDSPLPESPQGTQDGAEGMPGAMLHTTPDAPAGKEPAAPQQPQQQIDHLTNWGHFIPLAIKEFHITRSQLLAQLNVARDLVSEYGNTEDDRQRAWDTLAAIYDPEAAGSNASGS